MSGKHGTLDCSPRGKYWAFKVAPHVALRLKRIFPRMSPAAADELHVDNSLDVARDIEWFLTRYDIELSKRARKLLKDQVGKFRERETAVEMMLRGVQEARAFDLALPLRSYQQSAADFAVKMRGLLIADEVGLGKTAVGIAILSTEGARPALVCTLTHLTQQWQRELRRFAPKLRTHILKKATPYDLTAMRGSVPGQLNLLSDFPDVLICNYQKLAGWAETLAPFIKTLVWDEAQELRREDSDKYRSAKFLADKAVLRVSLTATPIYNYGSEMRNVLECTRPGELGEPTEFQREWCDGDSIKDPKAFGLYLRESGLMIRRTRADVGRELPKLSRVIHHVDCDTQKLDDITSAAGELAKIILAKNETARGEKFRASEQLSNLVRQATGIAKSPYVAEFVRMLVDSGERVLLYGWHRACFGKGTPVLMADGSLRAIEHVAVGDHVMGPDSLPRTVTSLTSGVQQMYRISPNKGDSWTCSANHTLVLRNGARGPRKDVKITAESFAKKSARVQRDHALYRVGVDRFDSEKPVQEPWFLGYWLGDGAADLHSMRVASADPEVLAECAIVAARNGLRLKTYALKRGTTPCKFIDLVGKRGPSANPLKQLFRALNLHKNKHIPLVYKTASLSARRELLAGLIDSDGHVCRGNGAGTAEVTTIYANLAKDIAFIARSLGLGATIATAQSTTGYSSERRSHSYRVTISGDLTQLPMRIARKRAPVRRQRKNVLRTGFKIEDAGQGEYFGFECDGDHLFLLGDFTVVHNCYDLWMDRLRDLNPVMFTGSESPNQKQAAFEAFRDGHSKVLIMSLRAGAGLDGLQHFCRTLVFGELDYSPGVHHQDEGRPHRDGQKDPVVAYYLVSDEGSDPILIDILGVKQEQAERIVDPNQEMLEQLDADSGDRIKRLAEAYLAKQSERGGASVRLIGEARARKNLEASP